MNRMRRLLVKFSTSICAVVISGCLVYQDGNLPDCEGVKDSGKQRANCLIRCALSGEHPYVMEECTEAAVSEMLKGALFSAVDESGLFASCQEGGQAGLPFDGIQINVKCVHSFEAPWDAPLVVFTVGIYPARQEGCNFLYTIDVNDAVGTRRQYRFQERLKSRLGILTLLAMPFVRDSSFQEAFAAMNRKVMNHLFVRMERDGFFSVDSCKSAGAVKAQPESPQESAETILNAERKKNLDSLLESGVISEEDYRRETERLDKGVSK